jgi:hypothetical protein
MYVRMCRIVIGAFWVYEDVFNFQLVSILNVFTLIFFNELVVSIRFFSILREREKMKRKTCRNNCQLILNKINLSSNGRKIRQIIKIFKRNTSSIQPHFCYIRHVL